MERLFGVSAVSLFSGIGGFDLGLIAAGIEPILLCENWTPARTVLRARFPETVLHGDVRTLDRLPRCRVVTAGFPCTDLSQAGKMAGIDGSASGLVQEVLRLISTANKPPEWLVLENVQNMLVLRGGRAMEVIVSGLESMGWRWAYRLVDARAFGLPQRRQRVLFVASPHHDPREVLFADEAGDPDSARYHDDAFGFYWTEGRLGLGWAQDATPTLKNGSTIGIASPPAIWLPNEKPGRRIVLPSVEDGEALQGFPRGWTAIVGGSRSGGLRWKLVGNAVPAPMAEWVGKRLGAPGERACEQHELPTGRWPAAGYGDGRGRWAVAASTWPVHTSYQHLRETLDLDAVTPLSLRATRGFLGRLNAGRLRVAPEEFRLDVKLHLEAIEETLGRGPYEKRSSCRAGACR